MTPLQQAATLSPARTQIFVTFSVDDTPLYLPHAFTMFYATLRMCGGLHPRRIGPLRAVRETFQAWNVNISRRPHASDQSDKAIPRKNSGYCHLLSWRYPNVSSSRIHNGLCNLMNVQWPPSATPPDLWEPDMRHTCHEVTPRQYLSPPAARKWSLGQECITEYASHRHLKLIMPPTVNQRTKQGRVWTSASHSFESLKNCMMLRQITLSSGKSQQWISLSAVRASCHICS